MKILKFYMQKEGKVEVRELGPIDLTDTIEAVKQLRISPVTVEIPEMVGFEERRAFMEFTKLSDGEYQVRYENPYENKHMIGSLSEQKAIDCLCDFFESKERWGDELEEY